MVTIFPRKCSIFWLYNYIHREIMPPWEVPQWQLPQWGEVDEQTFRPQWQLKFQAHFDKWFGLPQCLKTYHLSLYSIKKDMFLTGPFAMLSMPPFDFHLPPCTEGFWPHPPLPTMAIATLAIATVSLGGTISLCIYRPTNLMCPFLVFKGCWIQINYLWRTQITTTLNYTVKSV